MGGPSGWCAPCNARGLQISSCEELEMSLLVRTNEPVDQAPVNRAVEVYERLRRAIVEGSIRPKERLIESELAERVTCQPHTGSRSHVALGGDGLIVSDRRGWVVGTLG